jgi:hypothetical protein
MKKATWIWIILFGMGTEGYSQEPVRYYKLIVADTIHPVKSIPTDTILHGRVPAEIINGDTLPVIDLSTAIVFPSVVFNNKKEMIRYDKLVYNVKKVYPYAKLAGEKFSEYGKILDTIRTEKARKAYMKSAEKELEAKFGDQIRDLTYTQGKILIKLIYRQTGNSSYEIVKEMRGSFNAFMWQTLARIFGYDLKTGYDPAGEDQAIERIVQMIDSGAI